MLRAPRYARRQTIQRAALRSLLAPRTTLPKRLCELCERSVLFILKISSKDSATGCVLRLRQKNRRQPMTFSKQTLIAGISAMCATFIAAGVLMHAPRLKFDAITAEDIGSLPDTNLNESLQRL